MKHTPDTAAISSRPHLPPHIICKPYTLHTLAKHKYVLFAYKTQSAANIATYQQPVSS